MKNCLICGKELLGAKKSAKKDNGDFYLMCVECGNVHYVSTDSNGLTTLERTKTGNGPETFKQMSEAARLFSMAGTLINSFKSDIHSQKEDVSQLEQPEEGFKKIIEMFGLVEKTGQSELELWNEFKDFRSKLFNCLNEDESYDNEEDEEEDCDCDCDYCNEYEDGDSYEEDEESLIEMISNHDKYIVKIRFESDRVTEVTATDDEDLANMFTELEKRDVEVLEVYEIKVEKKKITKKIRKEITIE